MMGDLVEITMGPNEGQSVQGLIIGIDYNSKRGMAASYKLLVNGKIMKLEVDWGDVFLNEDYDIPITSAISVISRATEKEE